MPVIMPIVTPIHHTKECIVVQGKKYCEDQDISLKDGGIILLATAFLIAYIISICYVLDNDHPLIAFLMVFGPLVVGGILFLMLG
jgi:hypothetical protein